MKVKHILLSFLMSSQLVTAAPVFENVADREGLAEYQNDIRLIKDSDDPSSYYIIPSRLGKLGDLLAGQIPFWLANMLNLSYEERHIGNGRSEFSIFVVPKLSLEKAGKITGRLLLRKEQEGKYIDELKCYNPKLKLNNIPSQFIDSFAVYGAEHVLQYDIDPNIVRLIESSLPMIPEGFLYKYVFETSNPSLVRRVFDNVGAIGNASFSCLGYSKDMDTNGEPIEISTSVPISIKF